MSNKNKIEVILLLSRFIAVTDLSTGKFPITIFYGLGSKNLAEEMQTVPFTLSPFAIKPGLPTIGDTENVSIYC